MPPAEAIVSTKDISDFRLLTATVECRFEPAYLHWDRAGALWSDFLGRYPRLKLLKGEPNNTQFRLDNRFEFHVQIERLAMSAYSPAASLEEFGAMAEDFEQTVVRHLEIVRFKRIGLRQIFVKEYPNRDEASKALLELQLLWAPPDACFNISGAPAAGGYVMRLEDKAKGCLVQLLVGEREYEFEQPLVWEGTETAAVKKHDLAVDIDYYTVATASVDQVKMSEWIRQTIHVVRRDINRFLGSR